MFVHRSMLYLLVFLIKIFKVTCQGTSLCFVIDDTRSMYDDIQQVNDEIDAIMDIVLHEKSSQISNIVLVTFNDPDVKLRITTNNTQELKKALSQVRAYNYFNIDCPEMALTGVQLALENSLPGSYIYVFTDASAKDYMKKDEILQLSQMKQSQIVFVLTGDCGVHNHLQYLVYNQIATASSGMAFRVEKNEVNQVMKFIKETMKDKKSVLTSRTIPANTYTDVPFTVDDKTEHVTVSASGRNVQLAIKGNTQNTEKLTWTEHAKVIKLVNPNPGTMTATVKGTDITSVLIIGTSDFSFQHGFSELKPNSIHDTTPQTFSSTSTHLSISVTDPESTVQILSAQILDMDENIISDMPLTKITTNFYTTNPFVVPSHMFKVSVTGVNIKTGNSMRRISKIPVVPKILPKAPPRIIGKEFTEYEGIEGDIAMKIPCDAVGNPKPDIKWKMDGSLITLGKKYTTEDGALIIKNPEEKDTKLYTCTATNDLGSDTKTFNGTVTYSLNSEGTIQNIILNTDISNELKCKLPRSNPSTVQWFLMERVVNEESIYVDMDGNYTCHVSDSHGSATVTYVVSLVHAPRFQNQQEDPYVELDKTTRTEVLDCAVYAEPEPDAKWIFDSKPMSYTDLELTVSKVGHYECIVSNNYGTVNRTFIVTEPSK